MSGGYHVFNFMVHVLAALALYGVVRRTLSDERLRARYGSAANALALSVALLWVVHPLLTQAVSYIVQRAESLMGMFYVVTLYCFIRSAEPGASRIWSVLCVAACGLGMASKEVMVSAPVVVLLYDWTFLSDSFRSALRRRWPVYLGLAATWILLAYLVATGGVLGVQAGENRNVTWWAYALTEPGVILHYLRLAFWPEPLCLDYRWPIAKTWQAIVLPGVVVTSLLGATLWACWRKSGWGFLVAWFFLILALTSSILPLSDPAFEHRMYLPLAAVVAFVVVGLWQDRRRYVVYTVAGLLVATLGYLTVQRNEDYRSELAIWSDVAAKRPNNPRAHNGLGNALLWAGMAQEGIRHYEQALRIKPDDADAHNNLGVTLVQLGRVQDAIWHYQQALRIKPDDADAKNNLARARAALQAETNRAR